VAITEFSHLPFLERIQKYREMAAEARKHAEETTSQTARQSYLVIAQHWETLAAVSEVLLQVEIAAPGN
jgi:hypothetical protein